jgi:hypothetical protein
LCSIGLHGGFVTTTPQSSASRKIIDSSVLRSSPILDASHTGLPGAVRAAIEFALRFHAVADDLAVAMLADRRERMDCAFEAVECVGWPLGEDNLEGLIVLVPADFAPWHGQHLMADVDAMSLSQT